ncbi:hypothetical protein VSU19_13225 [Verrucomicrobiales bacterium BCK34]|nr:hypothetical protein [Verrucomicrobiales bacterium BCK34]
MRRTKGIIPLFFTALSMSFWSPAGMADEETASPETPGVMAFRLNSLSTVKTGSPVPAADLEKSTTTAQRSPRSPKSESFELSANASDTDAETTETSAERKPLETKSQTLRLSSRAPGIEFRRQKKTEKGPDPKKTRGPIATLLNNVDPQDSSPARHGDSVSPGLFKGHNKRRSTKSRLEEPSKLDQSPFRVEGKSHDTDSHDGHSLGLSEEVVPFTEYGLDLTKRKKTLTEVIEDKHFPENIERLEKIAERPLDDVDMELPERKTLFGNDRFLSPGPIDEGITVASGATWRPSFMLFGNLRTGIQSYESAGGGRINEWANRLDIFGNLTLTSTERLLIGFRPLDENGIYTGVAGGSGLRNDGFQNGLDLEPHTFFFEGYLDELFPFLDPDDFKGNDYGFSFGRQPFSLQDGIMANDDIDAFAITKHNMFLLGSSNARVSAWFGFNEINRGDNLRDSSAHLFALDAAFDYPKNTIEADIAYVDGSSSHGGDGLYFGLGHITQLGYWNSTFRVNRSFAMNRNTAAIDDGWLLTHQFGRAMRHSEDIFTMSSFAEFDNYTSVARGPEEGGSLGGFSLLHRAVGLGHYGGALSEESGDQAGQIFSYQHYLDEDAQSQLLYAVGYSAGFDDNTGPDFTGALGIQYQRNVFTHSVWRIGGFGTLTDEGDKGFGIRTELQRKF